MKINLNTLSPLNAVIDSKSGTAAAVSNMMNYYVDSGKAVPFNIGKRNLPVTPVDPLTEIAEWHFSEVDMVKVGKAYYEIDKTDNSVMPVGVNLGKITLTDNGSGGFLSTGGEEIIGAEHIASADGVKGITTVERTVGKVASCCSSDGSVILYGGANGSYSINSGTSWSTLAYNFLYLSMMGVPGSIIWGATATGLYYSITNGVSWELQQSLVVTALKSISTNSAIFSSSSYVWTVTQGGSASIIDDSFLSATNDSTGAYFNSNNVLIKDNAVFSQPYTITAYSDEPWGATNWAYKKDGVWRYRNGDKVPIPGTGSEITYICVTYGVIQVDYGPVYKGSNSFMFGVDPSIKVAVINNGTECIGVRSMANLPTLIWKVNLSTLAGATIFTGSTFTSNSIVLVISNPQSTNFFVRIVNTTRYFKKWDGTTMADISQYDFPQYLDNAGNGYYNTSGVINVVPYNSTTSSLFSSLGGMFDGVDIYKHYYYRSKLSTYIKSCHPTLGSPFFGNFADGKFSHDGTSQYVTVKRIGSYDYVLLNEKVYYSSPTGLWKVDGGIPILLNSSLSNCSLCASSEAIYIGGSDGIYKCDSSGIITFIGATISSCKMGGKSPFIGTNVGAIYLLGITAAIGHRFWNVKVTRGTTGYNIETLATNTTPLVAGTYIILGGVTGNPTPLIDSASYKQMILFKDNNSIVWVKRVEEYLQKFFRISVFSGIDSMYTYLPDNISQYGARFAMAGGYEVQNVDNIANGNFDSSVSPWIVSNTTWGAAYGFSGGGALIANGYIRQSLPEKSFCVALVKGSIGDIAGEYQVYPFSGSWYFVILGIQTAINIYSTGSMYVDSVHAYKLSSLSTTVSISDVANYEEFYSGSGSQQKVPSSDNVINGIIPLGKTLYVIKDNSTGKIDETGDVNNPFYVTEEMVSDGGSFPVRLGNSFIVARKRPSIGDSTIGAEIYLFNGQNYDRLNATWNNEWSTDSPFVFGRLHVGSVGDIIIVGNSAQYGAIISDDGKIGVAGFLIPGTIDGDITDGAYNQISSDRNIVAYTHNADPDAVKRLKGVSVLPEQDIVVRVWGTESPTVYTSSSAVGSCGFNLSGEDFFIKIDADEKIGQIIINEDTIMPRLSK